MAHCIAAILLAGSSACLASIPEGDPSDLKTLSLEELMDVEVTSVSRRREKLSETASAIQVITADDIRRSGATSLPEALRLADNLDVAQKNSHDWAITARGFNTELANKLLVLIDGRTVYTPLFSGVFWNIQDYLLADIDRIEVISGPGGTLWGANAVNGVINIITKSAADTQGWYAAAAAGTQLENLVDVRYGGSLAPNVYFRAYAKTSDHDQSRLGDGAKANDSWRMQRGGFRIDATPSARDAFTVQGDVYGSDLQVPSGGEGTASGSNVLSRWSHVVSDRANLSLQFYYDRTHLATPITNIFGNARILIDDLDTYDLDFQHQVGIGERHRLVWGLGYRYTHDVVRQASNLAFVPPRLNHNLYSSFIQDEIAIGKNVSFTLGTKLEHNDYTGFEWEPSTRLSWNLAAGQTLWAAVSRAVRTPSRVDRDISQPPPGSPTIILTGSPDFVSETVVAQELGYRAQFGPRVTASISAFYNEYDDLRSLSFTPATLFPLYFQNNLEGEVYGFELSVNVQVLDGWRLRGSYEPLRENIRIKPGKTDINDALNETSDPRQRFALRSSMDLSDRLDLDIAWRWVDSRINNSGATRGSVPSYADVDLRVAWRVSDRLELSLAGQNLLHDHHPEHGFPGPDRVDASRNIYGKLTWRY